MKLQAFNLCEYYKIFQIMYEMFVLVAYLGCSIAVLELQYPYKTLKNFNREVHTAHLLCLHCTLEGLYKKSPQAHNNLIGSYVCNFQVVLIIGFFMPSQSTTAFIIELNQNTWQ